MGKEYYELGDKAIESKFDSLAGVPKRDHNLDYKSMLKHVLYKDEKILLEIAQSRLESLSPVLLVATNKRLIIVYPSFWGRVLGFGLLNPNTFAIIPYKYIIGVSISKGKILSSIKIHTSGAVDSTSQVKDVDEVHGIPSKRAIVMTNFLGELLQFTEEEHKILSTNDKQQQQKIPEYASNINVLRSTARSDASLSLIPQIDFKSAKAIIHKNNVPLIWLGAESNIYISKVLKLELEYIKSINIHDIEKWDKDEILGNEGAVVLSYDGVMASHISTLLRDKYGIVTYTIRGGLYDIMESISKSN
ncbi:MAG: PH domain-containing protein [Candidatus Micrarchaeia archaeon]